MKIYRVIKLFIFHPIKFYQMVCIRLRSRCFQLFLILFRSEITIGKRIIFHQKTIFSGKGKITLKDNISFGYRLGGSFYRNVTELQSRYPDSEIIINSGVSFNNSNTLIAAKRIFIDEGCLIGANVLMMDFEAHGTSPEQRRKIGELGQINIGKNVWIGSNVIILKNVTIEDNCIIAAGSVVVKGRYPKNSIIGGNPARVIKSIC